MPIPGSKRIERVRENLGSLQLVLPDDQLTHLDAVATLVAGGRNIVADPRWISSGRE